MISSPTVGALLGGELLVGDGDLLADGDGDLLADRGSVVDVLGDGDLVADRGSGVHDAGYLLSDLVAQVAPPSAPSFAGVALWVWLRCNS